MIAETTTVGRTAHRRANYPGNVTDIVGKVLGPNAMGERMTAVEANYDRATDRTVVGFDFARVEDGTR